MEKKANNPHDAFVKDIMSDTKQAINILQTITPKELIDKIDWQSIKPLKGSFISKKMQEFQSDALFSVQMLQKKEEPSGTANGKKKPPSVKAISQTLQIYLLFEHKSYIDKNIHVQLGKYLFEIYGKQKKLTPVLPLVLYHGKNKWNVKENFIDMFGLTAKQRALFQSYIPQFHYSLLDVGERDIEKLHKDIATRSFLHVLRSIWFVEDEAKLRELMRNLQELFFAGQNQKLIEKLFLLFLIHLKTTSCSF